MSCRLAPLQYSFLPSIEPTLPAGPAKIFQKLDFYDDQSNPGQPPLKKSSTTISASMAKPGTEGTYIEEDLLDPETIPDVIRLRQNQIKNVTFVKKWVHEGVMIMQVKTPQRLTTSKTLTNSNLLFVVLGVNENTRELVTFRVKGSKSQFVHGMVDLTGRSTTLDEQHTTWCTGLQLKWRESGGKATYNRPGLLGDRKKYLKKLGDVLLEDRDDDEDEDENMDAIAPFDWAKIQVNFSFSPFDQHLTASDIMTIDRKSSTNTRSTAISTKDSPEMNQMDTRKTDEANS